METQIMRVLFGKGASPEVVPAEIIAFCELSNSQTDRRWSDSLPYWIGLEIRKSPKYWKIDRVEVDKVTGQIKEYGRSSYGSVDFEGNIFKSATYQAVAKGVRGNVFIDSGSAALTGDGFIRYLK
jgi:hypothetical protein